ncbi:hypothetical protein Ancab_005170 [Ancistrocladus abbreviatus]
MSGGSSGFAQNNFQEEGVMGRVFLVELEGIAFRCTLCQSPLALVDRVFLFPSSIHSYQGLLYLADKVVNTSDGPEEEKMVGEVLYIDTDVYCCCCGQLIGWKFMAARDKNQKSAKGNVILKWWGAAGAAIEAVHEADENSSDSESS